MVKKIKDRQHNGQKDKGQKGQIVIYKTFHRKRMIEQHEPHTPFKPEVKYCTAKKGGGYSV